MFLHAARMAAQPNSSLKALSAAFLSLEAHNNLCAIPAFCGDIAARSRAAVEANFRRRDREDAFGASGSLPPRIPSPTRGHASGPNRRPVARRRSASLAAPLRGLGSSQKEV